MALPTKEEILRRKQVMQNAGIKIPNTDESWDSSWEELWQKTITHDKTEDYYGKPSVWNSIRMLYDNITNNTTYQIEPQPIGGTLQATDMSIGHQIKQTLNNWQHDGDPIRDITLALMPSPSKPVEWTKGIIKATPTLAKAISNFFTKDGVKKAGAKLAETIIRETPRVTAGYFAGKGVNMASKTFNGKSWGENASDFMSDKMGFHVYPIFGELTNPGYIGGYKWMDRGIRRAAFNQITPISYIDDGFVPLTKTQEFTELLKDVPKQLFNFKSIKIPAWRSRMENIPGYNPNAQITPFPITIKNFLDNREQAMRLVFGQKQTTPLYVRNNNGTYSYDLDFIYKQQPFNNSLVNKGFNVSPTGQVTPKFTYRASKDNIGYYDNLGWNGGYVNYTENNGISHISDVFDVQPFIDGYRTANIFGTGNFMHKYLPDFEAFRALGGKPFKLEMTLPTYDDSSF